MVYAFGMVVGRPGHMKARRRVALDMSDEVRPSGRTWLPRRSSFVGHSGRRRWPSYRVSTWGAVGRCSVRMAPTSVLTVTTAPGRASTAA
jgi:hypothetical protein